MLCAHVQRPANVHADVYAVYVGESADIIKIYLLRREPIPELDISCIYPLPLSPPLLVDLTNLPGSIPSLYIYIQIMDRFTLVKIIKIIFLVF